MNVKDDVLSKLKGRSIKCASVYYGNTHDDEIKCFMLRIGHTNRERDDFIKSLDFEYDGGQILFGHVWLNDSWIDVGAKPVEENEGETSDHLYEFIKYYSASLFNAWYKQGTYNVYKSKKDHTGEYCMGGGWFVVMATTPYGQISNHYKIKDWDLFWCGERGRADEWSGHTSMDILATLRMMCLEPKKPVEDEWEEIEEATWESGEFFDRQLVFINKLIRNQKKIIKRLEER